MIIDLIRAQISN